MDWFCWENLRKTILFTINYRGLLQCFLQFCWTSLFVAPGRLRLDPLQSFVSLQIFKTKHRWLAKRFRAKRLTKCARVKTWYNGNPTRCVYQSLWIHDHPSIIPGWWLTYPSEKYESQLGWSLPIYGKNMFQTTSQIMGIEPISWPSRFNSSRPECDEL